MPRPISRSVSSRRPRGLRGLLALALAACVLGTPALAQPDFPGKPIVVVVPFPPAGSTDVMGRLLAQAMSRHLPQPVAIENTGGAGGTIGAARVARAQPDGHTLLFNNMAQASAPAFYAKLGFDPLADFEPIGLVADVPMILVARKDFPADSLSGLLAWAKANPGRINFANAGVGATSQLCEVLLRSTTGADWTSVPYKGTGPALTDLRGGQVDMICDQPASTLGHIRAGALKPIAVANRERLSALPDVPTFSESGVPGFNLAVWHGLYAPKGTPRATVDRLAAALRKALAEPAFAQRLQEMNAIVATPEQATPEALRTHLRNDLARWKNTLRDAGIKAE